MKRNEQNCMNNKFSSDFLHDKNFCGRDQGDFFVFYLRDYAFPDVLREICFGLLWFENFIIRWEIMKKKI